MSKNKERYIAYLNMQYFEKVCKVNGVQTLEETEKLRLAIYDQIQSFLTGRNKTMLFADIFTTDNGLQLMKQGKYMEACTGIYPLVEKELEQLKKEKVK